MDEKKLARSQKKYIRKQKARIRREVLDLKKQEELINELYSVRKRGEQSKDDKTKISSKRN